jgi:hypothetical protein
MKEPRRGREIERRVKNERSNEFESDRRRTGGRVRERAKGGGGPMSEGSCDRARGIVAVLRTGRTRVAAKHIRVHVSRAPQNPKGDSPAFISFSLVPSPRRPTSPLVDPHHHAPHPLSLTTPHSYLARVFTFLHLPIPDSRNLLYSRRFQSFDINFLLGQLSLTFLYITKSRISTIHLSVLALFTRRNFTSASALPTNISFISL